MRAFLLATLANDMFDELLALYRHHLMAEYQIDHTQMAKRALKNGCLNLLAFANDNALIDQLVVKQYQDADNMTDSLAALNAAVKAQLPANNQLLRSFDDKWHQDGLVMDKWLMLQATSPQSDALENVKALLNHRSFTLNNPNRIRALIGAFVNHNPVAFHAADGRGYQFLVEMLTELNQKNPQVASRLIDPLIRFKRYDQKRSALMQNALQRLLKLDNLSKDLYEKITKALNV